QACRGSGPRRTAASRPRTPPPAKKTFHRYRVPDENPVRSVASGEQGGKETNVMQDPCGFLREEDGQDLVEYTLLISFVALASAGLLFQEAGVCRVFGPPRTPVLRRATLCSQVFPLGGCSQISTNLQNRQYQLCRNRTLN